MRSTDFVMLFDAEGNPVQPRPVQQALQMQLQQQLKLVHVIIKNQEGQIWVGERQADHWLHPKALQVGVFSYVGVDESYKDAIARQAFDDLGIDLVNHKVTTKASMPSTAAVLSPAMVYEVIVDAPVFDLDPFQFSEGAWMSAQELIDLKSSKKPCVPECLAMFYHVYLRP